MASVPSGLSDGSADPGDSISNDMNPADVATGAQLALANGHSWGDISMHVGDQDTGRPSLGDVFFSGNTYTSDPSNLPVLSSSQVNEGAGPVGEAILGAAAGGAVAAVRGAVAGAASLAPDAVDTALQSTRAAALGVQTAAPSSAVQSVSQTLGSKWVRRSVGALVGAGVMHFDGIGGDPDQWDKDFASQASMVNKGMTDEQNRRNK